MTPIGSCLPCRPHHHHEPPHDTDTLLPFLRSGHTVRAVCESFQGSKDAGFKVVAHMMPDLPNVGLERDIEQFIEFFENPVRPSKRGQRLDAPFVSVKPPSVSFQRPSPTNGHVLPAPHPVPCLQQAFRPDGLKLYPTLVIRGTGLYELWKTGRYKSYPPSVLIDLVARILALVPPWTRVYRVQRYAAGTATQRRTREDTLPKASFGFVCTSSHPVSRSGDA